MNTSRLMPHTSRLSCCLLFGLLMATSAIADVVHIKIGKQLAGRAKLTGTIVGFNSDQLRLRLPSGNERRLPSDQVTEVETSHSQQHEAGDQLFAKRQFALAREQYEAAATGERRAWVRRNLQARIIWCDRYLGRQQSAGDRFLLLLASETATRHFDCIPLAWNTSQARGLPERSASEWMAKRDNAAAELLGASYLLSSRHRADAIAAMKRLAAGKDARIALLSQAQLLRASAVTSSAEKIVRFERVIEQLDPPHRTGPYYVWGQALAQKRNYPAAALAYLRVPLLHPKHRDLAASALLEAGDALRLAGRVSQAASCYRELASDYAEHTKLVDEAQRRLDAMKQARKTP